jgi:hypothetical protein
MRELPRLLIFCTAVTCGILIALAAHIVSARIGLDVSIAGMSFAGGGNRLKSALAWWLVAGSAFASSFITALLLKHASAFPSFVHWLAVGGFVVALAAVGRAASEQTNVTSTSLLISGLAAFGLGTIMALCGTYFAMRS